MGDKYNTRIPIPQDSATILAPESFKREDLLNQLNMSYEAEEQVLMKQLVMDAIMDCIDSGRFGKALKEKVEAIKEHSETRSLFWKSEFNKNHLSFFGLSSNDFSHGAFYNTIEEENHCNKPVMLNEKEIGYLKQAVETKLMDTLSSFIARHKALSFGHCLQSPPVALCNSRNNLLLLKTKRHSIMTEFRDKNKSVISILEKLIYHRLNNIVCGPSEQLDHEMKRAKLLNMKIRVLELKFTALVLSEGEKNGEAMQLFKQNLEKRINDINQQLNNLIARWEAYQKHYENLEYKSVAKEYVKFQKANKQNEIALKELF